MPKMEAVSASVDVDSTERPYLSLEHENEEFLKEYNRVISDDELKDADDKEKGDLGLEHDPYLEMELALPRGEGDEMQHATVKKRAVGPDGKPMGVPH